MAGFELGPNGIMPLGGHAQPEAVDHKGFGSFVPAVIPQWATDDGTESADTVLLPPSERKAPPKPTKGLGYKAQDPRAIIKAAKARIKELNALLREAKLAERERDELVRLVAAAAQPKGARRTA